MYSSQLLVDHNAFDCLHRCPLSYDVVCAGDHRFDNQCEALCGGASIVAPYNSNLCSGSPNRITVKKAKSPLERAMDFCQCDRVWLPVCVERKFTYSNACMARCNRQNIFSHGTCDGFRKTEAYYKHYEEFDQFRGANYQMMDSILYNVNSKQLYREQFDIKVPIDELFESISAITESQSGSRRFFRRPAERRRLTRKFKKYSG